MLKKEVVELQEMNIDNQSRNKELEQYGRHLCLRIDSVPTVQNESSYDVLEFTKSLFKEANVTNLDNVLDCVHRIGPSYTDRITSKRCKSIIVRFTTFQHRTLFYRASKGILFLVQHVEKGQRSCQTNTSYKLLLCRCELSPLGKLAG